MKSGGGCERRWWIGAMGACILVGLGLMAGCDREDLPGGATRVRLALNWKPEPQFGGFYQAAVDGRYASNGLDVEILEGGAGMPTVQMVGAGRAEFGIVSADEIVIARANGNDVVALFAVYQDCPQGLMTRADRGFNEIGDIFRHPGTVAMQEGLPYARILQKQYGFDKVRIVPSPGGDISQFLSNPNFTQQCFVTSEPLAAEKQGVLPKTFLVKETGYNPYTGVLATSGKYLRGNPEQVKAMVAAVKAGWDAYLADPTAANARMLELRPDYDEVTMLESARAQQPLILTEQSQQQGVGWMTRQRWQTLIDQLKELGDITDAPTPESCYWAGE